MQRPRNFVSVITTSLIIGLLCAWPTPITFGQRARPERRVANITLAPTNPPRVQLINVQSTFPPDAEMTKAVESIAKLVGGWDAKTVEALAAPSLDVDKLRRQIAAMSSWGTCKAGDTIGGDGSRSSAVRLTCERGTVAARLSLDPETHRLAYLDLVPTREQRCVP